MMAIDIEKLSINPLFYDLLSGKFEPVSDKFRKPHQLGRLAVACFLNGEVSDIAEYLKSLKYTPSWAPHVEASIEVARLNDQKAEIRSLTLTNHQKERISGLQVSVVGPSIPGIARYDEFEGPDYRTTFHATYALTDGKELDDAQLVIASRANSFINTTHLAT